MRSEVQEESVSIYRKHADKWLIDLIADGIVDRFTCPDGKRLRSSERFGNDVFVAEFLSGLMIFIAIDAIQKDVPPITDYKALSKWVAGGRARERFLRPE
jgi:hypothetical protein